MNPRERRIRAGKLAAWLLCALPLAWAVLAAFETGPYSLGPNPVEALLHHLGIWGLNLLLVTLAVTPLRRITGFVWLTRFRRMLGLYAFAYVSLHLLVYLTLDRELMPGEIWDDVARRPHITAGVAAFLLILPLAITSTQRWRVRLGRHWQRLHRLVYPATALGVLHYFWLVKLDRGAPLVYAAVLAALLALRWLPAPGRAGHRPRPPG